jgi:hypothetical protein
MASVRKGLLKLRSTLSLPQASSEGRSNHRVVARSTAALPTPARRPRALTDGLQELLVQLLWPMVETAFRDTEDHVEARFLELDDLQVVISRAPARGANQRGAGPRVTLELWPTAGPRVLVVEWSGRRPHVVLRRDGDWLQRLIRISRQSQ